MRSFEERYEAALADPNVRQGLTAFQRGWRVSRDAAIAGLEAQEGRASTNCAPSWRRSRTT